MGKVMLFCILALVLVLAVPAYAEVQNVKVSGDLAARYLNRNYYSLDKHNPLWGDDSSHEGFLMSTAEVAIDADMTDNVSTVVRLVNQRTWGELAGSGSGATGNSYDVVVDLASVTLKEMVYSPLTVTIGRQDLWFGKGFIIGAKQRDPNGGILPASGALEYTAINSFDAIRATLDFDPWKIDGVYSQIEENALGTTDDVWLMGANIGYKFDSYKGEAEAYTWLKKDRSKEAYPLTTTAQDCAKNFITTLGARGSFEPIANASIAGELAWQLGQYSVWSTALVSESRNRNAMAADLSADYAFKDVKWSPKLGIEYIYYSGEEKTDTLAGAGGTGGEGNKWNGWDPMYRGKFDTAIREFQNVYYRTAQRATYAAYTVVDQDSGVSNEHQLLLIGSMKPINNLKVDGRVAWFRMAETQKYSSTGTSNSAQSDRSKDLGTEIDVTLTYDYTEDVSFGLLTGWFFPGKYWIGGMDDTASDIVGTVKVAF